MMLDMQEVLIILKTLNLDINLLKEHNPGILERLIHVDLQEI